MLDVLVVALVAALVQFRALTSIEPRAGILFFGLVVILTMLSAMSFDPRLDKWMTMEKMNPDSSSADGLPALRVSSSRFRPSLIWLVLAVAALIGLSLPVLRAAAAGPKITIRFQNATGLEAGKTVVKYKDVVIGNVSAIVLSDDNARVVVTVDLKRARRVFAREGSRFWIVRSRIGAGRHFGD